MKAVTRGARENLILPRVGRPSFPRKDLVKLPARHLQSEFDHFPAAMRSATRPSRFIDCLTIRENTMFVRQLLATALALVTTYSATAATRCDQILERIGGSLSGVVTCFESTDLTTANPLTTPVNNTLPGLPAGAWTPQTDRNVISPNPPNRTPITKAVPGVQLEGYLADDPTGEARFLLRLPDDWNGDLVVAGASGTRSEFNGDFSWSDYVVQKG